VGGLFGDLDILPNEFTPKDVYQLKFYKDGSDRPEECVENDPELPYCQIMGEDKMELNKFNTIEPYQHMNEHCGGQPPEYFRDAKC